MWSRRSRTTIVWSVITLFLLSACSGEQPSADVPTAESSPSAASLPTTVVQPAESPTTEISIEEPTVVLETVIATVDSGEESSTLRYYWPQTLPLDLEIQADRSSADESSFVLEIAQPGGGQFFATITGGPGSRATQPPPAIGSNPATIRGVEGVQFSTGAGVSLFWQEAGHSYAVLGSLGLDDALALAESLEPLDLATWQSRLAE